jgi:pyrroline-5-carboxylate reductase
MPIQRIGFVGAGKMATALGQGFVRAGLASGENLLAADPDENARRRFAETTGGKVAADNAAVASADALILAVKPAQMAGVCTALRGKIPAKTLVISLAAGVPLACLQQWLGDGVRLVRTMPNMPCLIGQGATGYSLGKHAIPADAELVEQLLRAVGIAVPVEEALLDAVTGLSGSGPAFVYEIIAALSDAGARLGLPAATADSLAVQTVRGAAEMVRSTGDSPAALRDRVASPGGTTVAGLKALEAGNLRDTLIAAVEAAAKRSQEIGREMREKR